MNSYVISIAPDDGVAGVDAAQTTVRVDTSTGQALVKEVNFRAPVDGGLSPTDLPKVDLDLLIRALTTPASSPALPSGANSASAARPEPVVEEDETELVAADPEPEPAPAARARRSARKSARGAAKQASARKGTAAKKQTRKRVAAKTTRRRGRAAESDKRPYRRMPDASEVMAAYEQVGTITGLAEHFDVPRHTVAAWARRLRSEGYAIGRQ